MRTTGTPSYAKEPKPPFVWVPRIPSRARSYVDASQPGSPTPRPAGDDEQRLTRVMIVDEGACSREGLCALLATVPDVEVVATAADGQSAVRLARQTRPDVIVLDARLPLMDGLEATRRIKACCGWVRVVMLSFCSAYRGAALAAGADAFLVKGGPVEDLVSAIRAK